MKKIFFYSLLFLLFELGSNAQNNLLPIYRISTDTTETETLPNNYWQTLEDKESDWTLGEVTQNPLSNKFSTNYEPSSINYKIHSYWVRYRLKNVMNEKIDVCLTNSTNADQTDFFVFNSINKWTHFTTGVLYPWDQRDGFKKINYVPLSLNPGEEILVYNRIKNSYFFNKPKALSVIIGFSGKFVQKKYADNQMENLSLIWEAIFVGVLLFGLIFNFYFFAVVKERIYIYFSLFLLYLLIENGGWLLTDIVFTNNYYALFTILALNRATGVFFLVQFIRHFFKTFDHYPRWDRLLFTVAIAEAGSYIMRFMVEPFLVGKWSGTVFTSSRFLFDLALIMILITVLKSPTEKNSPIRLLKIASTPALFAWVLGFTLTDIYGFLYDRYNIALPSFIAWLNLWFDQINATCTAWFVIIFSTILFQKFIELKKKSAQHALEKEKLAREREIERNQLIERQKIDLEKQVTERTAELKQSLEELKSTQAQLIQSEKMASLGELTAGIAHEIQNPLNFVNNFSDVNRELVDELEQEIDQGKYLDAKATAKNIKDNEQKINHHGKRADAIVKGMLQHSQRSSGQKETTDINRLADEYLRLAYHGLRTKDKSFNVKIETDFDNSLGIVNVIPQEIGRVILNLINNALYAVAEKSKRLNDGYGPIVKVSTKRSNGNMEITVSDNGNGIPQKIVDKIFQPFFTTKPTGEGTGLGLSLAYDIVKAHGGEIKVETEEGKGSEFIVQLPFS